MAARFRQSQIGGTKAKAGIPRNTFLSRKYPAASTSQTAPAITPTNPKMMLTYIWLAGTALASKPCGGLEKFTIIKMEWISAIVPVSPAVTPAGIFFMGGYRFGAFLSRRHIKMIIALTAAKKKSRVVPMTLLLEKPVS